MTIGGRQFDVWYMDLTPFGRPDYALELLVAAEKGLSSVAR